MSLAVASMARNCASGPTNAMKAVAMPGAAALMPASP
jgi:hypothetical protein